MESCRISVAHGRRWGFGGSCRRRHWAGWLGVVLLAVAMASGRGLAQDGAPGAGLTVTELMEQGRQAFAAGEWESAAGLIGRFLNEYGDAEEVEEAVVAFRPLMAVALLRLNRFAEALPAIEQALEDDGVDLAVRDELMFWRGVGHMQLGQIGEAQLAFGQYYADERFNEPRRQEAAILYGTCFLMSGMTAEAADFFSGQMPVFWQSDPEAAGRAVVLLLHSQLQTGRLDEALEVVRNTYPRLSDLTQLIAFQTLCLQLGSMMLEQQRYHDSIICLQRVLPRERLLDRQQRRLALVEERLEQIDADPRLAHLKFQYQNLRKKVERELESFQEVDHFDSALRLRLASAYIGLERYLQAALILDDMLVRMEPNPVVEQATLTLMQCWSETERWDRVVEVADRWLDKFDAHQSELAPRVLYLKASALRDLDELTRAEAEFGRIVDAFPEHDIAAPSLFLLGICQLEQDLYPDALAVFRELQREYGDHPQVEDAFYWEGMALSFTGQHERAREHMRDYLERHGDGGKYAVEARFRVAFSTQALAQFEKAEQQLGAFIEENPMSALADEARILLGDALGAMGEVQQAIDVWRSIDPASTRFHEEGWFKAGDGYKRLEDFETMQSHFELFVEEHPTSGRLAEAVYWIGWSWQAMGEPGQAERIYWETIEAYGNDPDARGVEDVLVALGDLYPGDEARRQLAVAMKEMASEAVEQEQEMRAVRLEWARGHILDPVSGLASDSAFLRAAVLVDPERDPARILIDCAEALMASGQINDAEEMFRELRRWHPRALQRDRAFLGLARISLRRDEAERALGWLQRFDDEIVASSRVGEHVLLKADVLEQMGRSREARVELEKVLEMGQASAELRARTLVRLGDALVAEGKLLEATAYYERVYVSYGKFAEPVAEAYWKRGRTLEQLGQRQEAVEVYRELARRGDLAGRPEARQAVDRLNEIEPGWREAAPEPGPEVSGGMSPLNKEGTVQA